MGTAKWGQVEMALRSGHGTAGPSDLASLGNVVSQLTDDANGPTPRSPSYSIPPGAPPGWTHSHLGGKNIDSCCDDTEVQVRTNYWHFSTPVIW